MAHEYFKEMLTTHALSALDRGDEQALEQHLATCQECQRELEKWRATSSAMAFASPAAEPSPAVRERLLAQISAEKSAVPDHDNVVQFVSPRKEVRSPVGSLIRIAAVVIVGVLLISIFVLWRENRSMRAELDHEREIVLFMTRPGSRVTELAGTKMAPGAHAMIAFDKNGEAMLMTKGLPAAPAGKAYQLWFIVGNNKMPGRTFNPDNTGNGNLKDEIPAAALSGAVFAVTLEPTGGVKVPTGDIFLVSGS